MKGAPSHVHSPLLLSMWSHYKRFSKKAKRCCSCKPSLSLPLSLLRRTFHFLSLPLSLFPTIPPSSSVSSRCFEVDLPPFWRPGSLRYRLFLTQYLKDNHSKLLRRLLNDIKVWPVMPKWKDVKSVFHEGDFKRIKIHLPGSIKPIPWHPFPFHVLSLFTFVLFMSNCNQLISKLTWT